MSKFINIARNTAKKWNQEFIPKKCNIYMYDKIESDSKKGNTTRDIYMMNEYIGILSDGSILKDFFEEITKEFDYKKVIFQCPRLIGVSSNNGYDYIYHKINNDWKLVMQLTTSDSDTVEGLKEPISL